jgi:hypothetical protein
MIADKAFGHVDFPDDTIYFVGKHQKLLGGSELRFEIYQDGRLSSTCAFPLAEFEKIADPVRQQFGTNYGAGEWKTVNQATIRGT